MKFSVSTYSYCRLINSGEKTLAECIALAAQTGFDGVEFVEFDTPDGMTKAEYAAFLREECKKNGVEPVSYTIGADFLHGSDGDIEKEIARLKGEVEIADALGVKLMRHDATRGYDNDKRGYKAFSDALPRIIEGCRAVTEYAKTFGIRTMVENHGFFCQESCRVEKIVNGVANDNFGLLVDIGNFMCADEDPAYAVGVVAPYAFHVHAFIKQTRSTQPDIEGCGLVRSTTFITFVYMCVLSLIFATPKGGVMKAVYRVFWEYPAAILTDPSGWFHDLIRYF
jgi:sugar phosphate isomerase/epimerase